MSKPKSDKATRRLTVSCAFRSRKDGYVMVPAIRLAGGWLHRAGFYVGDAVEVNVRDGELRIVLKERSWERNDRQGELF